MLWRELARERVHWSRSKSFGLNMGSKNKRDRDQPRRRTPAAPKTRLAFLQDEVREDLADWIATDPRIAARLVRIMDETLRSPFEGIGKPEPLKATEGAWSRWLTGEHRVIYYVHDDAIDFVQARLHYSR